MKPILRLLFLLLASTIPTMADTSSARPMRDAATSVELSLAYRKAAQNDPMKKLTPTKGEDPTKVDPQKDILSQSDIVCFGSTATLVPKRAILNMPKNLADRLKLKPGCRIQSWSDFYALNRGWITTVEVSRVQAEGNQAIAEEIAARIGKSSNLVVATFMGGPISVLPLKTKEAPAPAATASTTK